jgi:hypothetical protein
MVSHLKDEAMRGTVSATLERLVVLLGPASAVTSSPA